ncbi:bifunctional helix-turn-helix transcriptional regulator/GNAT family N-acetyltransferase [Domibacillus tundrae]|uniref:bifunctional helix-turn-helix transcriptional regulator/GNAT family N-acetyltransferase n=1 Tax=Domibacillus tundrae TaxID=1587527 RepID=UPI003394DC93
MDEINFVERIRNFNRHYANVLGKIDQEIYNQPFSLTEARVITELNYRNGCTATDVRENLGIDRGYMSRIIQRFEKEKIIVKKQSSADKRQYSLYLTEYGQKIYKDLVENANRGVNKMIQTLSPDDLSKLVTSMEMIESIYSKEHSSQSEVFIRPFQSGDAGYIAYLHGRLYDKTYNFGQMFEYYVMKGLTEFMNNTEGGELWVAEVNGKIAGSIAITKSSDKIVQLRWFILDNHYQGRGIGKKLMETALHFCKEQNYQHVFLWTVSTLKTARYLYQKYHFKLTEEKPNEEWTGTKLIEERWDLDLSDKNQTK